jgi:hypothetical protein
VLFVPGGVQERHVRTDGVRHPASLFDGELTAGRKIARFRAVDADHDSPNVPNHGSSEAPSFITAAFAAIGSRDAERSVEEAEFRFIEFAVVSSAQMGIDFAPAAARECDPVPRGKWWSLLCDRGTRAARAQLHHPVVGLSNW